MKKSVSNPALKPLEVLIGNWDVELSNASFLQSKSDKRKGTYRIELLENGGFLVIRQTFDKPPSPPVGSWIIGRDDSEENYSVLYYDDRGVSRRYEMSFNNTVWKIWREAPPFWQRFEAHISSDGQTITATWELSNDNGKNWEHDFDLIYQRAK
jgi:hypothetical protein